MTRRRFQVMEYREAQEFCGIPPDQQELLEGHWAIVDTHVPGIVGVDGGEPEDQLLVRDWAWVVEILNEVDAEKYGGGPSEELAVSEGDLQ